MNPFYPPVAQRANYRCEYCHAPQLVFNIEFEVDHIVPLALGGSDDLSNLALACRACNLRKGKLVAGLSAVSGEKVTLFNPRLHVWNEHFVLSMRLPHRIEGVTEVGAVTVQVLRLNDPLHLLAREKWFNLNLLP
ncbi:MAG: HNH endonuclease [Anaerolineae bacterium]|nr:HNH endonuclease [Anaerolineae bacterium]